MIRRPLLFLPGPMQVPDPVRAAAGRPLISHRSPQMSALMSKLVEGVRPIFGTDAEVIFLASSGTGAMESAVSNLTSPGDEVLVVVGGTFAQRWKRIAEAYGLTVRAVDVDWRKGATVGEVERALLEWPRAEVVFLTWSESSTGVLLDLAPIGNLVRNQGKILVADAVSGLAVSPLQMDEWNADVVVAGSQKGLMLPPGLGLAAVGKRGWERAERSTTPRFYWDWRKYRSDVPATPATSLLLQLDASLDFIHTQGLQRLYERRAHVAETIRKLVKRCGLEIYALNPGNGITAAIVPELFNAGALLERLETQYGISIAGGLGPLKDETFRIGHVGHVSDEELDYFITSFERSILDFRDRHRIS